MLQREFPTFVLSVSDLSVSSGNFKFDTEDDKLKLVLQKVDDYCIPKKNTTFERHKFFTCVKKSHETLNTYENNCARRRSTESNHTLPCGRKHK